MFYIHKIRADHVIDYAAEELKKYLRMMMPQVGDIKISFAPEATDGFRLGLLSDFGITAEKHDPFWDDIVHIETTEKGGILAGSNPRSVLFAVYRFLKLNGCRFLFAGIDGEHIPRTNIGPQSYHKMASYKIRGHSVEGDPSLEQVLDYIDFHAKSELNVFGCYGLFNYMRRYYNHRFNEENRKPEFMDIDVAETQWRALFEAEAMKRGLILYGGDHGLFGRVLGLNIEDRFRYKYEGKEFPAEITPYLAEINGERTIQKRDFFYTNLCMSKPEVRKSIVDNMIKRMQENPHIANAHLSLADGSHNHCECAACRTKRPADWVVMILNELDEEMTAQGIDKVVGFSFYVDVMFAPAEEKIKNPDRFIMNFCPITRTYSASISSFDNLPEPIPFQYNAWKIPRSMEALYALLKAWRTAFTGAFMVFEYHFWIHQYRDPGLMSMSRRIYEDVVSYKNTNMIGCMEDGSNKSFFPNGFHGHIYAETLFDRSSDYEAELEDYFSHLYGPDWRLVREYLDNITNAFNHKYMLGELSADPKNGKRYNPDRYAPLSEVKGIAEKMREIIKEHMMMPTRPQSVAWRLLRYHTEYCAGLAAVMMEKCLGHHDVAADMLEQFIKDFGKHDLALERYFDFGLCVNATKKLFVRRQNVIEQ